MKKVAIAVGVLILLGVLVSSWRGSVAVVANASSMPVLVRLETDVGESYPVADLAAGRSAKVEITPRDKALWAVAQFPGGKTRSSDKVYVTSHITVTVVVTDTAVHISYAL